MDNMDLQSILAGVPIAILLIDDRYQITDANPTACEIFGRDLEGENAVTLLRQAPVLEAMDHAMRDGARGQARFLLAGTLGEVSYAFAAHPLPAGGAVLSFEDMSHAEESEIIRRDFVANISHELRTPLTGLIGFIETLRGSAKDDPKAQARFLEIMEAEAIRMSRMVSDLLSLSRVQADERVRPRREISITGVVRSAIATLEGKLSDAGVRVEVENLSDDVLVLGDRDQLTQLFLNLIENAIKYGGSGKTIHVTAQRIARDATLRCPSVRLDVRDEGPGIDEIHLPRLTERFYRVDDHRSREMGGTGLGLAIVKHIVGRHRGRMKITSTKGVGSQFSVIFPTA